MDRRNFLRTASVGVVGATFGGGVWPMHASASRSISPAERINVGVIGVGSRGRNLMQNMLRVPGVRIAALCDVYEPSLANGVAIVGQRTPLYRDYRRMLDERSRDLDAVLVSSPLGFHTDHVVASLQSGLHVFGEKSLAYDIEGCDLIVKTARRTGRLFQVGHQYRYAPWCQEAVRRINAGEIGEVTHIVGFWHRNNSWRRPLPQNPPPGWTTAELERLINWRLYREHSRGLLAELGSHHLDIANWLFGATPQAVVGTGGIAIYRDGRESFDHLQAIFEYPGQRRLVFSSMLNNHRLGYQIQVLGTGGSLELTLQDATFYFEPDQPGSAVPEREPGAAEPVRAGVPTGPTLSPRSGMPYRGPGERVEVPGASESATLLAVRAFFESVRYDARPFADERVGWRSAVPVIYGDEAVRAGGRVQISRDIAAALGES